MAGFTWEAARTKLVEARERALQLGGPDSVARQRAAGRWTIRERIDYITDPRSFLEVGTVAVHERFDPDGNRLPDTASGYVMGLGQIDGRDVAVGGEDFTVEGGVIDTQHDRLKGGMAGFIEELAHEYRIPLVMLMEGVGGGVGWEAHQGHAPLVSGHKIDVSYKLMGEVPVMAAAMGACAGCHRRPSRRLPLQCHDQGRLHLRRRPSPRRAGLGSSYRQVRVGRGRGPRNHLRCRG